MNEHPYSTKLGDIGCGKLFTMVNYKGAFIRVKMGDNNMVWSGRDKFNDDGFHVPIVELATGDLFFMSKEKPCYIFFTGESKTNLSNHSFGTAFDVKKMNMNIDTISKSPIEKYMRDRAQQLISALSPHNNNSLWMVSITGGEFNKCDPSIDIEGITIYVDTITVTGAYESSEALKTIVVEGKPKYQVAKCVRMPGRMYYPDGSGEPDSDELVDVGESHKSFDEAVIEACKLLVEMHMHDFLEAEAEVEEEEAYRSYEAWE